MFDNLEIAKIAAKHLQEHDQCSSEWDLAVYAMSKALSKGHVDTLSQLCQGPTEDGYVLAKSYRDDLLTLGLASRTMNKNEFGYTSATYVGGFVNRYNKEK